MTIMEAEHVEEEAVHFTKHRKQRERKGSRTR
jgi:hypothetical protein